MKQSTLRDIKDGWINYVKSKNPKRKITEEIEQMAIARAEICKQCDYLVPRLIVRRLGFKCVKCGCSFPANVYAPNKKCPIRKW